MRRTSFALFAIFSASCLSSACSGDDGNSSGDGDAPQPGDGDGDSSGDGDGDVPGDGDGDGDGDLTGDGDGDLTGDGDDLGGAPNAGGSGNGGVSGGSGGSSGGSGGSSGGSASTFTDFSVLSASYVDGNSTHWEQGRDIAWDSQGNIIIVGGTSSSDYPTTANAYDEVYSGSGANGRGGAGDTDVFVSKFDQQGNMIWSTFLGGYNYDRAYAVEVGPNDDVFIAGRAGDGFPTTSGVLQTTFSGDNNVNDLYGQQDAFVTRLAADGGSIVWSTYVGESGQGIIRDIDVDPAGVVYLAYTGATGDLPTPDEWGPTPTRNGWDGFYGKLSADGSTLLFGTYMGGTGSGNLDGREPSVRVTPDGRVYYLTWTDKADFGCITPGAYDETHNGGTDLVLAHFDTDNTLLWCTFVGGDSDEGVETHGLAVDKDGNAVIAAFTASDNIPTTAGSVQPTVGGSGDAYLAVFSPQGALLHGSYFGGTGADWAEGVDVAPNGDILFSGGTENSPNLPTAGTQFKQTPQGREGLVVRLSPDLSQVLFSGPYGGSTRDEFRGIAANASGDVAIVGLSESTNFPTVNAFDTTLDSDSSGMPDQGITYLILKSEY